MKMCTVSVELLVQHAIELDICLLSVVEQVAVHFDCCIQQMCVAQTSTGWLGDRTKAECQAGLGY